MPATDREIVEFVLRTCLTFGASLSTSLIVAGLFLQGVRHAA